MKSPGTYLHRCTLRARNPKVVQTVCLFSVVCSVSGCRISGTTPADTGTPQWITLGIGGFREERKEREINGGGSSTKGGRAKNFLKTLARVSAQKHGQSGGNGLRL
uniref:PPUP8909 n=1 Tax=Poeciliopsis prolifica TaxID=188132 RepID=A0A0S7ETD1_9TELE